METLSSVLNQVESHPRALIYCIALLVVVIILVSLRGLVKSRESLKKRKTCADDEEIDSLIESINAKQAELEG